MEIKLLGRDGAVRAVAVVDDADAGLVGDRRWFLHSQGYACANVVRPDGRKAIVLLHRVLLGLNPGDGREVDHRDGDPLNCRRSNLRIASRSQNMQNVCSYRGGSSRYRGVSWHKGAGKWMASATLNRKAHYLGLFEHEAEAAEAARVFRAEHMPFSLERTRKSETKETA
jgi:hypothetical protein